MAINVFMEICSVVGVESIEQVIWAYAADTADQGLYEKLSLGEISLAKYAANREKMARARRWSDR